MADNSKGLQTWSSCLNQLFQGQQDHKFTAVAIILFVLLSPTTVSCCDCSINNELSWPFIIASFISHSAVVGSIIACATDETVS